jgi:hypothetical protein
MRKTCSKCGEAFELLPGKPGFVNVCPSCTQSPEASARKAADGDRQHREWAAASRDYSRKLELSRKSDLMLESFGYVRVPGTSFTITVPND